MQNAKVNYSEGKVTIALEQTNKNFSEYLLLGLGFDREGLKFTKLYQNQDLLAEHINQIYKDAEHYNVEIFLDPFLSTLIKKYKKEEDELQQSIIVGNKIKRQKHFDIKLPKNFYREPKNFQKKSILHAILVSNSANFSVPGSGKTTISLAAYSILKEQGVVDHLLVVGPISAFLPWEEEFKECFKRIPNSIRISGNKLRRVGLYNQCEKADIVLISYQMLKFEENNIERLLKKHKFFMVLDESHHIKNFYDGIYANVVRRLSRHAARRLILTGTPIPNSLEDLWSQFTFLWPNEKLLGTKHAFKEKIERGTAGIKSSIDPLFVRITKDELNIPKPIIKRVGIKLKKEHYEFYYELSRAVLHKAKNIYGSEERDSFYRVCIAWLLQAIDDPNRLLMNPIFQMHLIKNPDLTKALSNYNKNAVPMKVIYAKKLIESLVKSHRKVLFWTYFVNNIEDISKKELRAFKPLKIYGGIPLDDKGGEEISREEQIRLFKTDKKRLLLVANPAACAESISLHMDFKGRPLCKDAIYLDRTLNCAQYLQSLDRIHRIGIKTNPEIKILLARGTIDEFVDMRLNNKEEVMLHLLDDPFKPINLETDVDDYFGNLNKEMENENRVDIEMFIDELKKVRS